jgi:hypothetical protein
MILTFHTSMIVVYEKYDNMSIRSLLFFVHDAVRVKT